MPQDSPRSPWDRPRRDGGRFFFGTATALALVDRGLAPLLVPCIEVESILNDEFDAAVGGLDRPNPVEWVVLTSVNAVRAIVATVGTGYCPTAVSFESITASVPSRIAFATSATSARVGRGLSTIERSICVAVITNLSCKTAFSMICF